MPKSHDGIQHHAHYHNQGFTLVEIMVVVVILSIFAGVVSVSVGKSDTQKNRAYYEHLQSSLKYIRLISAERMQPMGIRLVRDDSGQLVPEVVRLNNAYASYQNVPSNDNTPKNSMELSVNIGKSDAQVPSTPTWSVEDDVELPQIPTNLVVSIDYLSSSGDNRDDRDLQPWFQGQQVPKVVWFGTGQTTPASITVRYNERLVGDVIHIMPDGGLKIGNQ